MAEGGVTSALHKGSQSLLVALLKCFLLPPQAVLPKPNPEAMANLTMPF